jgi:hypothetical protein
MHNPILRPHSAALLTTPEILSPPSLPSSSRAGSEHLGIGPILCLAGLAIAALATIVAFFGVGYLLLAAPSSEPAGSAPHVTTGYFPSPAAAPANRTAGPVSPGLVSASGTDRASTAAASDQSNSAPPQIGNNAGRAKAQPISRPALSAADIGTLLTEGDDAFRRGDLTSARLLYRRAYEAADGRGALGIGASYDPHFLQQYHIWTQSADPEQARIWYLRARDLGAPAAQTRLKRLDVKPH